MKVAKYLRWFLLIDMLICGLVFQSWSDGGYVSKTESIAISADQRAIIIKNGDEISMTFSTGYTGEGDDFGWIIPTPVPPAIDDVSEAGEMGETAFEMLEKYTAPVVSAPRPFAGQAEGEGPGPLVTVYGRVTLEHYEVSILGAAAASPLLGWLQNNGYEVDRAVERVLDGYIREKWAFVAVKLNPDQRRHYENEFLPPLTIKYRHDRLVFPLRISSVSTAETARITLYVIAESTVSSSNLATTTLRFKENLFKRVHPESYVESCIRNTLGDDQAVQKQRLAGDGRPLFLDWLLGLIGRAVKLLRGLVGGEDGRGLVVIWSGGTPSPERQKIFDWQQKILDRLMKTPFSEDQKSYLTRLETRMDPASMIEDIMFVLDSEPKEFQVRITARAGFFSDLTAAARDGDTDRVQKLLQQGADVNEQTEDGWTALMMAVRGGHTEVVRILLRAGTHVNVVDGYGMTAMMWADRGRHTEIVKLLRKAGSELNVRGYNFPDLLMAALRGHAEVVQILLEAGADVDMRDEEGWTALIYAADMGHVEVVQILLEAGADAKAKDGTALAAGGWDGHPEIVTILLKAEADADARAENATRALRGATVWGREEVVGILLEAGADAKNATGALVLTAEQGHAEVVQMLLKAGADVDERWGGETALMKLAGASLFSHPEIVSILVEAGADVNARYSRGETPLMKLAGAYFNHPEIVSILVEAGADVNAQDDSGRTPLMIAASRGNAEIVQILLEAGADVDARHLCGWTALIMAAGALGNHPEIVSILVQAGSDVDAKNDFGESALMRARGRGHTQIVNLLLKAGAKK